MQAWMPGAPPPGALGADSLALAPVARADPPPPGKVGVVPIPGAGVVRPSGGVGVTVTPPGVVTVVPPLPRNVEVVGGDKGATGATWGAGVPMADGGSARGAGATVDGAVVDDPVDLPNDDDGPVEPKPEPELAPPPCAAASCSTAGMRRPAVAAVASQGARGSSMVHLPIPAAPRWSTRLRLDSSAGPAITSACVPPAARPAPPCPVRPATLPQRRAGFADRAALEWTAQRGLGRKDMRPCRSISPP